MRGPALAFVLAACGPAGGGPEVGASASAVEAGLLRDCATITPRCQTVSVQILYGIPACRTGNDACFLRHITESGRETLAAQDLPGGAICGFRFVEDGPASFAIFGRWNRAGDNTRYYEAARFLSPGEAREINSLDKFKQACATLS